MRGEQLAAAAEPGGDLVEDEQDVVRIGEPPRLGDVLRRVEPHATSALDDRLENDGRYLVVVAVEQGGELIAVTWVVWVAEAGPWAWREELGHEYGPSRVLGLRRFRRRTAEDVVHPGHRIAHAHGGKGVAVVPAANRQQPLLAGVAGLVPVLDGHLDGDLDRHRPRVAEEDPAQRTGSDVSESLRKGHGRLVCKTAEHDMRHSRQLGGCGRSEYGVVVAMDRGPPRRHSVDYFAPVA